MMELVPMELVPMVAIFASLFIWGVLVISGSLLHVRDAVKDLTVELHEQSEEQKAQSHPQGELML